MARAMACSIAHPTATGDDSATAAIEASVQTVLNYQPATSDGLLEALFTHIMTLGHWANP
jgi:hypothetical protein